MGGGSLYHKCKGYQDPRVHMGQLHHIDKDRRIDCICLLVTRNMAIKDTTVFLNLLNKTLNKIFKNNYLIFMEYAYKT